MKHLLKADAKLANCIRLLNAGVAFPDLNNTKKWNVYSHEGDFIGNISTFYINTVLRTMKLEGIAPSNYPLYPGTRAVQGKALTYGFEAHFPYSVLKRWMNKFYKEPLNIV